MEKFSSVFLETEKLQIGKLDMTFAMSMQKLSVEKSMRKFIPDEVFETIDDARKKIQFLIDAYKSSKGPFVYPIILKDNKTYIGHVEACKISDMEWEVGYHIGEQYQNNGYATEAVSAFTPYIIDALGINEIYGICLADNLGSHKVLEHCGFQLLEETMGNYLGKKTMIRKYKRVD